MWKTLILHLKTILIISLTLILSLLINKNLIHKINLNILFLTLKLLLFYKNLYITHSHLLSKILKLLRPLNQIQLPKNQTNNQKLNKTIMNLITFLLNKWLNKWNYKISNHVVSTFLKNFKNMDGFINSLIRINNLEFDLKLIVLYLNIL